MNRTLNLSAALLGLGLFAWAACPAAAQDEAWRVEAQYDTVDEVSTADIHRFTTDPKYITPMVSFIPDDPTVPSPRDFLGYIAGAEGKLTHPDDTARYFDALAEASPRIAVEEMGSTEESRRMQLVVVTSEANMARLDELKGYTQALSDPRGMTADDARAIVDQALPFMHITAGLHSPETGPPEMVMELAYRIAVSKHPDIEEIRNNVVLLITPVTDVDGRARVVEWYYRYLQDYDSRFYMPSYSPPYWGKYTFHDNNRDGIQLTQKLTQNYLNAFNEWHPVYSLDLHESVPLLYVSGGTGPYNQTIDPITINEWQMLAHWEMTTLQRENLPGVWTWGFYTGWNPSYLLWVTNNRNAMGRFYETFGNSSARTMERDLRDARYAGKKLTDEQWYRPDPPDEKVVWSLRNNTNYMQSGVLASLTFTARNGGMLLENYWRKGRNSIQKGFDEKPHAYLIPREQRSADRLSYMLNQLVRHGIEVHEARADLELDGATVKTGDYIVRLDQPYGNHARNLLRDTLFPEDSENRPYDDVSWTFGHIYRLDTKPVDDPAILQFTELARISAAAFPGTVGDGPATVYAIKNTGQNSFVTARYMLKRHTVYAAEEAFEVGGETFPIGSWLIPARSGLADALGEAARACMLDVVALETEPDVPKHELDLPKVALYHNWVNTQPDGWLRYTLEQYAVPYDYINDDDIKRGGLKRRYDIIMMADQRSDAKTLIHGRDTKYGAMPYTKTRDYAGHGVIDSSDDITGGIGFKGMANLEDFLDDGGTLLLMGGAGRIATDTGLLRNVDTFGGSVDTPGSSIQITVDRRDHPIVYGFEDTSHVFRTNGPLYSVPDHYDHWIVAHYGTGPLRDDEDEAAETKEAPETEPAPEEAEGDEPKAEAKKDKPSGKFLLSGFVSGKSSLEKKAVVLDVPRVNGGRVILYSFNPMHRYLNHGDHNFIFNALLNWNDFPDPQPKEHPELDKD